MPTPSLPTPYQLNPGQIGDVIRDCELQSNGHTVLLALDCAEVIDFCFPVPPDHMGDIDIDEIGKSQAALSFAIFGHRRPPVLLPEYHAELYRYLDHLNYVVNVAYRERDLQRLLEAAASDATGGGSDVNQFLESVKDDFHISLAVSLGRLFGGIERYNRVLGRLKRAMSDLEVIENLNRTYLPSKVSLAIHESLGNDIRESRPEERRRKMRAAIIDSAAIDRVLQMNHLLEDMYLKRQLDNRVVILYVSNAKRNEKLFSLPEVQQNQPVIEGRPYNVWRKRDQIYLWLQAQGGAERPDGQSLEILRRYYDSYSRIQESQRAATEFSPRSIQSDDVRNVAEGEVAMRYLKELEDARKTRRVRDEVMNLGLVGAIGQYKDLLSTLMEGGGDAGDHTRVVLEALRSEKIQVRARQNSIRLSSLALTRSEFGVGLRQRLLDTGAVVQLRERDQVTNRVQSLPDYINFSDERCRKLANEVVAYFDRRKEEKFHADFLLKVQEKFARLEAEMKEPSPDLELIRCLMYLSYPLRSGHLSALRHSEQMTERFPELKPEWMYIACWTARRLNDFEYSIRLAKRGIEHYPDDPRFYHGKSLALYSWWKMDPDKCQGGLGEAIEDAQDSLKLFERRKSWYQRVIAATHNNLAYFFCEPGCRSREKVRLARYHLEKLKECLPRDQWGQDSPEYFDTEATVLLREYSSEGRFDGPAAARMLEEAEECARMAIGIDGENPDYSRTLDSIQRLKKAS